MDVTTSHKIIETAQGDVTFSGRCKYWGYDLVDGIITPGLYGRVIFRIVEK